MYIRVPREKVAPLDTGRTETVQHHISQSAEPQNASPVLQSVPVQLPAPASQQWVGDSSSISYARLSVLQPGVFGDTSVDKVDTEPHLEALTQHVAGRLAVPGASAAAEESPHGFLFGDYCNVGGAGRGPVATVGGDANRVDVGTCWACACGDFVGPAV